MLNDIGLFDLKDLKMPNKVYYSIFNPVLSLQVADFGLAKFTNDTNTHVSTRVMGTFG